MSPEERNQLVCHSILQEAFRQLGGAAVNLHGEVIRHKGPAYEAAPSLLDKSTTISKEVASFAFVKKAFFYEPLPKAVGEVYRTLLASGERWDKISDALKKVKEPNRFTRIFKGTEGLTPGVDLPNGFEDDDSTAFIIPLLAELKDDYAACEAKIKTVISSEQPARQ